MKQIYKTLIIAMMMCTLVACNGTDGAAQSPASPASPTPAATPSTPATPTPLTMKEQIKALEDNGKLPKLDRSTSIAGPDINNNGIRDDIDVWIAALPITDAQKNAAEQTARVRQKELLVDLSNKAEHDRLGNLSSRGLNCMTALFMPDYQKSFDLSSQIEAITANTKERAKQYLAFNRAVSGSVVSSVSGDTCEQ